MSEQLKAALEMRQSGYRPYRIMNTGVGRIELISYPFPEKGGIFIMGRREPGNPESIARFELVPKGIFHE